MKYILLAILLLVSSPLRAQDRIFVSYNPGMSLLNSENSTKTLGGHQIEWFPGISLGYATEDFLGLNVILAYDYSGVRMNDVQLFPTTSPTDPQVLTYAHADYELVCSNIDIAAYHKANEWFSVAAGPTLSFVSRSIVINDLPSSGLEFVSTTFEDRLVSFCLGMNGSMSVEIPLQTSAQHFCFYSSLKLRYLHSVWFDNRGRNLAGYYQSFLFGQLHVGLGYNF